jgi:sulfur-oxidizing protein SoxB
MTGHWEFTYGEQALRDNLARFKGEFLAQNVFLTEEAAFNDAPAFDKATGRVFKPSVIKELGGHRVAIVGQAFPYVPIAHPKRFTPDWTFGIREEELQKHVDGLRGTDKVDAVILLSHNGMDVDLKLASRVRGIDAILGGHTHDGVPVPVVVGSTLVTNAGSHGKFVALLDLDVGPAGVRGYRYRLLPVFANLLPADGAMAGYIGEARKPYASKLREALARTEGLLYRRGNFNGTFDELILRALLAEKDAEIAFSPGFRWGPTLLPGDPITVEDLMAQTAITYPQVSVSELTGAEIKAVLEDIADNLFNADPYLQQGGDMVRVGAMTYAIRPAAKIGGRISDLRLAGKPLQADKRYKVAGWAPVREGVSGEPVWDVVGRYLRAQKRIAPLPVNQPRLEGVGRNAGLA